MRTLIRIVFLAGVLLAALLPCQADVAVKGYTRKNGTYVAPHVRSSPNSTKNDNYSTKGNVNPYTGKAGTKPRDAVTPPPASTPAAPTSANSSAPAKSSPPAEPVKEAPPPSPWAKIHVGMAKAEVAAALGSPTIQTAKKWVYQDSGTVTFDDKGKLDGVTAPK